MSLKINGQELILWINIISLFLFMIFFHNLDNSWNMNNYNHILRDYGQELRENSLVLKNIDSNILYMNSVSGMLFIANWCFLCNIAYHIREILKRQEGVKNVSNIKFGTISSEPIPENKV